MQFLKLFSISLLMFAAGTSLTSGVSAEGLSGTFHVAPMKTGGMWYMDDRDDGSYLIFSTGFNTGRGPNLQIYLSKASADEATGRGLDSDKYVGGLKAFQGAQSYKLPKGVAVADYASIVIVCDKFHKLWAASDLAG
jgi:hypothetical protein